MKINLTESELSLLEQCLVALHAAAIREPGQRISLQLPAADYSDIREPEEPSVSVVAYSF